MLANRVISHSSPLASTQDGGSRRRVALDAEVDLQGVDTVISKAAISRLARSSTSRARWSPEALASIRRQVARSVRLLAREAQLFSGAGRRVTVKEEDVQRVLTARAVRTL
jgi:histone H3/H4